MADTHIRSWSRIAKLFMLACGLLLCTSHAMAASGVTITAATGGTAISADTTGGTYTTLTGPTITENNPSGVATTGTVILNAPSGFIFDTGSSVTATVSSCSSGSGTNMLLGNSPGSSSQTVTPTTSAITINVFQISTNSIKCTLTWSNIRVRPISGTPLASGNITRSGGATMTEVPATTNYGTLTEVVGAANKLAYGVQPSDTVAGASISPAVTVKVQDQFGNTVTSNTSSITLAIGINPGGGTLSGATVAAVAGVATFSSLSINKTGTGYTLAASATSLTSATSSAFNITPATATKLIFSTQPTNTAGGAAISPAVTVTVQDQFGNTVTSNTSSITLVIGTNPSGGTLSGTTSVAAVAGVATFSTLSINNAGTGYTLAASGTGLTGATSAAFNITVAVVASFNAVETAANAVTGKIFTKIAGQNFAFDIVALNASNSISTTFTGAVTVEVVDSSTGVACASMPLITTFTNQTFIAGDAGRHALTSSNTVANSWVNARVRIKYPTSSPTIISCSTDNFAIRPASLASFSVTDGDWQTAGTTRALGNTAVTGGNVHKAGRPFTLQATAVNALITPTTTTNYTGTPTTVLTACAGAGCPTAFGTVSIGSAAVAGVINSTTATYSEVGAFTLQLQDQTFANVDAADGSTTAQRYITSATLDVGRFVPDHFDGAVNTAPVLKTFNNTTCASRSFTYIGQPFGYVTLPQATFTAKNFSGVTTANYKSTLWKLVSSDVSQAYAYTLTPISTPGLTTTIGTATVTSNSDGTGTVAPSSSDTLAFTRLASAQTPFTAAINLTVSVSDSTEAAVTGNGTIATSTTALFSSMSFDSGSVFRYGRLQMQNAHGSELLNLPIPLEAQYWNGSAYVRNASDSCTTIPASSLIYSGFQSNLAACQTHTVLSGTLNAGRANPDLKLTAPGNGKNGSVNLAVNVGSTASGSTCTSSSSSSATAAGMGWFGTNPSAKATFGIHKTPLIYLRENF